VNAQAEARNKHSAARACVHRLGGKPEEIGADTAGCYILILVPGELLLAPVISGMGDSKKLEDRGVLKFHSKSRRS
jgi:hypothetical protein